MKLRRMTAAVLAVAMTVGGLIAAMPVTTKAAEPVVVVLDPGHGGGERGAVGITGAYEKDINLKISLYTKEALEKYPNVKVFLTRTTDETVGLTERTERAKAYGADIFISQHCNSITNPAIRGAEVFVSNLQQYYPSLRVFGEKVLKQLTALGIQSRGVKVRLSSNGSIHEPTGEAADYYAVIAASANRGIPGTIIEHAFMSNAADMEEFLSTDAKLRALGEADAAGIADYFQLTGSQVENGVNVAYQTHVQNVGWQGEVLNGATSGTTGKGLRLEGIRIKVTGDENLGVEYSTHVQNVGWQDWVKDGGMAGTEGRSFRLETIRVRLTGESAFSYDIYYRVHSQDFGWLDWAKNGSPAGTLGSGRRLEGIDIRIVDKGAPAPGPEARAFVGAPAGVTYQTYVQSRGWLNTVRDGASSGTVGQGLRMEALRANLSNLVCRGGISYRAHIQNKGWVDFSNDGNLTGGENSGLRLEAIEMKLTGEAAELYDIYYRIHSQQFGWLDWAKNGESAGTAGYSFRVEGIEIKLVPKNGAAPGPTARAFVEKPPEVAKPTSTEVPTEAPSEAPNEANMAKGSLEETQEIPTTAAQ